MNDTEIIGEGDDRILAAEYVLGLLPAAQRARVEDRLGGEPALRAEVAHWQESFVSLTDSFPEVTPPDHLWQDISVALDTPMTSRPKRRGFGILGYALGGILAAGLAFVVVNSNIMSPAMPEYQARVASEDSSLVFAAAYDVDTGELALQRQAGTAAPGRSFELWLIAGDNPPVSVIVWPDNSTSETIRLPAQLAERLPGGVLAISDEPAGGSPTGLPTGAVLALGPVQGV